MSKVQLVYGTNTELVNVWSDMVGPISVIVRTRRTLNRNKLFIDVTTLCEQDVQPKNYLKTKATHAARRFGATSTDCSEILGGFHNDRKISNADGSQSLVHVRRSCFVFDAV